MMSSTCTCRPRSVPKTSASSAGTRTRGAWAAWSQSTRQNRGRAAATIRDTLIKFWALELL
eukprot:5271299-Alexandrium_andersonii.AAC.1